jgi:hypothetical protein
MTQPALTPREFVSTIYRDADAGWLTLFSRHPSTGEQGTDWFTLDQTSEMVDRAMDLSLERDVWFGLATRTDRLHDGRRGGAADCAHITALWVDIDVAGPNHKGDIDSYPDDEAARKMIREFPVPVTTVVRTGGGYHGYWLLDEPLERDDATALLARWGAHWSKYAQDAGYKVDNVFDLPRVLRVPGTFNRKNGGEVPVEVEFHKPQRVYSYSHIVDHTDDPPADPRHAERHVPYTGVERPGDDFNSRKTGSDVLSMAGWTLTKTKRNGEQAWQHPWGASTEESATVYPDNHITIWSDNVPKHHPTISVRTPYDPYGLYARIFHDGDFHEATIDLAKKGYGAPSVTALMAVDDIPTHGDTPLSDDQIAEIEEQRRKSIIYVGGAIHLDDIANDVVKALLNVNDPPHLFKHGDVVSQFTRGELEAVDRMRMVNVIETNIMPKRMVKDGVVPARVENNAVELALLRLVDRLPGVEGVVRTPFLRADGSVCADVGYDVRSGNYLASTIHTNVPDQPTSADVTNAVALIEDLIHDFPLKSQSDRAHVFALLLTPIVRHLVPLTPLFILDGNGPGVGKNLLAESCMYVATGSWVQTDPLPTDSEEQRKQITALMSTGRSVALFDEAHIVTGTSLARMITSTTWGDRLLGYSKQVSYPNRITVCALGNNVEIQGDMPRRSVIIRLESQLARPYDRQDFRHDNLRDWVEENRPKLVGALLTMLVSWHQAGRPKGAARLGSFDAWAEMVGGTLAHAGVRGFMTNVAEMRQRGAGDEQDMAGHLWELHGTFMAAGFTTKQVAKMLEDDRLDAWPPRMGRDKNYAQSLGYVYRHYSDRWMDGIRIRQDGVTHGARRWVLELMPVDNSPVSGGDGGLIAIIPPTYEDTWSQREAAATSPQDRNDPPHPPIAPREHGSQAPQPRAANVDEWGDPIPDPGW